jgi:hypothetical protein
MLLAIFLWGVCGLADGGEQVVLAERVHLRLGEHLEWSEFADSVPQQALQLRFNAEPNASEYSLRLRQEDVKQTWQVTLNGQLLGQLTIDENAMLSYFAVPAGLLKADGNELTVRAASAAIGVVDDIRVGEIVLDAQPVAQALAGATLQLRILDRNSGLPTPARVTLVTADGALQPVAITPSPWLAVRSGTVYTARGETQFQLPPGDYRVSAGRGFEFSLAEQAFSIAAGQSLQLELVIEREVPTAGYVACDTHIHTLTRSGHGDATLAERLVTLCGEGIELPIATDHNVHVDYEPLAQQLGVRQYFTPVVGNEVTTPVGHFNIFPVPADASPPNPKLHDWNAIFSEIRQQAGEPLIQLNHGRDLHSGVTPLGPRWYNSAVAENLEGWPLEFHAMEIVNSSATQSDIMQLPHDWMTLLGRGVPVTPIGSSDSHDVLRHFVGQGRTYIRCDDSDPGAIDVAAAVASLRAGRVLVSYGLLAELQVAGRSSGEMAPSGKDAAGKDAAGLAAGAAETLDVDIRVLGPHWVQAETVELFVNGELVERREIASGREVQWPRGVKYQATWQIPRPNFDVHLVAIARGPGIDGPHWRTAKPYQPDSSDWQPQVIGVSGAVWIDADGDGQRTPARRYAERAVGRAGRDPVKLVRELQPYDAAVAAHAAELLFKRRGDPSPLEADVQRALDGAPPAIVAGFERYFWAWRSSLFARAE